jgi:salicylate 5-hydroxylase small subunit
VDADTRAALADLYAEYAACLDEARFADWPELFVEDCLYLLQPRENHDAGLPLATMRLVSKAMLKDRIYGVSETLFHAPYYQRHLITGIRGREEGGVIRAQANFLVVRTKRSELSDILMVGRYLDRVVRTDQGLRFAEKLCVFDSELIPNSVIYPI